ncbi:dephospho-CoA kinase [Candidatus Peregrinibacteria bacterium]|nr:dephospho-CoA kinase [Candidatus Peregrinibacteria bacterium]
MKKAFILGVTGVVGSGKSSLCRYLEANLGFHWINADAIVHELYRKGEPGYEKIKNYFGSRYVDKLGVNRNALRKFALKSPQKMWILNKLIHPLVFHIVNTKIAQIVRCNKAQNNIYICIEALYFDASDLGKYVDQLLVIDAPDDVILKRLRERNIPEQELKTLLLFQRKNLAHKGIRIMNEESLETFYQIVLHTLNFLVLQ